MRATPRRNLSSLDQFIESYFNSKELLLFLEEHCGRSFVAQLPMDSTPMRALSHDSVRLLDRQGLIDHDLIAALIRVRPARTAQLRQISDHLALIKVDDAELKTVVWRPNNVGEASSRLKWVEKLEKHLLIRERALDDTSRGVAAGEIDRHTRFLRSSPIVSAGSVVAGARLERELGRGNFGTVWLSRQIGSGAVVATKIFNLDRLGDGVMLWRFRRSIRAMALLGKSRGVPASVPRLVEVSEDTLAFSMTYLNGGTLEQVERRGWSLATKLSIFAKVCQAAEFAHSVGIIHRDIKPANILLGPDASPVLVDYDIADIRFVTQLSVAHGGLGTPIFAAPEQLEKAEYADERSDIYSLGRLLHYLLLEGSPGYQIERDPTLDNLRNCSAALVAIVRRATQWDPRRRFPTVGALLAELSRCQTGLAAVRARALGTQRWVRHNALLLAIAGTISIFSMGIAVLQRDYANVQAELVASKDGFLRLARVEQGAARTSAEQIQQGLQQLSKLREELNQLDSSGTSAELLLQRARQLGSKLDTVQANLDRATVSLSRHQDALGAALKDDLDLQESGRPAGPQTVPPRVANNANWGLPASQLQDAPTVRTPIEAVAPPPIEAVAPPPVALVAPPPVAPIAPKPSVASRPSGDSVKPSDHIRPDPGNPAEPKSERDSHYRALTRAIDRQVLPAMKRCLASSRFSDALLPIRLDITIAASGRLQTFDTKPPLGDALHECLRDKVFRVDFDVEQEEEFVYVLK